MFEAIERGKKSGLSNDKAILAAFEENMRDVARVGGN
jgi:glutamate synthase (ferredoxin)